MNFKGNPPQINDLETERVPDWVHWLAQDADGVWWGYEVEPQQHHQGWYENELGRCVRLIRATANPEWQKTLRAYP